MRSSPLTRAEGEAINGDLAKALRLCLSLGDQTGITERWDNGKERDATHLARILAGVTKTGPFLVDWIASPRRQANGAAGEGALRRSSVQLDKAP